MHRPQQPHFPSLGGFKLGPISDSAQTAMREAAFWEPKLCLGNQPHPQSVFAQESNGCLNLTEPLAPHRAKEGLACLWLLGPCCLVSGLHGLKPTANMFSFGEKADWAGKGLVFTVPRDPPPSPAREGAR